MRVTQSGPYDQILLFGDSIMEQSASQDRGFAFMPALQDAYIRRLDVINRGFSGYTSSNAIKVLPQFMPSPQQANVRLLVVFFGANDSCLPGTSTGQHVPLDVFSQNLQDIILDSSVAIQQPLILLITPPAVNEYSLEEHDLSMGLTELRRTADNTRKYAEVCCHVGEKLGVPVLDIWSAMMNKAGWKPGQPLAGSKLVPRNAVLGELLSDGLHFRPEGYRFLYQEFMNKIQITWPELSSETLSGRFPLWPNAPS